MISPSPETPPPANSTSSDKLSFATKLAYGAGDMGPALTSGMMVFFLLFFFTNVAGLSAGLAGSVLMVGKIWDAVNDPMVGVLSDRTRSRWGRRLPWIALGAIPFGLLFCLQWLVPHFSDEVAINQYWLAGYYIVIAILFNTFYTAVNLPYTALTAELTQDYNERTSLTSFRFAFSISGSILSLILAQAIFSLIENDPIRQYATLGIVGGILAVLPFVWCLWGIRDRAIAIDNQRQPTNPGEETIPLWQQIRIVFSNRPFLFVVGIYLCAWLGVQLTAAIIPYFVVTWMELPDTTIPTVLIAIQGTALAMLFPWSKASEYLGKKVVYFMGMGIWIVAEIGLFFLQPGQTGWMYVLAVMAGIGVSTAYLIPWSMLPDTIELDELQTGQRREGVFYAFMVLLQKFGLALGLFLVGQALEFSGFQESLPGKPIPVQPDSALMAIRIAIGPLPTIVLVAGLILAYFYPITRDVHAEIVLKLKERKRGQAQSSDELVDD